MALALHANSTSGTLNSNGGTTLTFTTASITLPDACMVYVQFGINNIPDAGITITPTTPTNTGTGLTWTLVKSQITQLGSGSDGGGAIVYRAYNATSQSVTITAGATSSGGSAFTAGAPGTGYRVDLWTGAASDQSSAQTPASGRTTTQAFTSAMTTTASGSQLVVFAEDWAQSGTPTAGTDNTIAGTWNLSGLTSGGRVCLTSNAGAAGSYTSRITFGGTPAANWIQYEILAGAGATQDQEGARFGADDGSESAHTWSAAQDANLTAQTGSNVLLRALINATGDAASAAYTLRYQKNGSGGYVAVPVGSSGVTSPPQVTSATVASVTTAADPWSLTNGRPAASSGDLVVVVIGWDDSVTVTSVTPPAGPNSEAAVSIAGPVASNGTEMRLQAWYYITTGSWTNATWSWDPSASETCRQAAFVIPAGQFKSSDPIGWASTTASAGTGESNINSPTGTAESDDGDGRLFIAFGSDADAITAPASGTTTVNNGTTGGVGLCIVSRNTVVSNSESIAAITATIASDSWATVAFVVKPATTTNELYVATSGNIAASGADATTARLTAPTGKSSSTDFVSGKRVDDANSATIDITTDDYTEVEWCLRAQSPATNGDYYDFRVYAGASALDTYGVTPRWTIGTPATPSSIPRGYRAAAFHLAALMGY